MNDVLDVTPRLSERRIRQSFWAALGPSIRDALADENTIEIMINEDGVLWVETYDGMEERNERISAEERDTVVRLLADARGTETTWELQAELIETGDRFQAILPPVVPAPSITIRKHRSKVIPLAQWEDEGRLSGAPRATHPVVDFHDKKERSVRGESLSVAMRSFLAGGRGIIFGGTTGSGKTTLLNSTALLVPEGDRVITVEDVREINIPHIRNKTQWLTIDGVASMHDLTKRSLRMRPDRIIIGEARDGRTLNEALKISLTIPRGTMMTTHATSAEETLRRMDNLISEVSMHPQRELVASVFGLVVHLENKRVTEVLEVHPCRDGQYSYSAL